MAAKQPKLQGFVFTEKLGSGTYATVYKAFRKTYSEEFNMAEDPSTMPVISQMQKALHSSASSGDHQTVARLIGGIANVNGADDHGWTALMLAARNGHDKVVQLLLDKGCDHTLINKTGQSALAIAEFWHHPAVSHLISKQTQGNGPDNNIFVNFFGLSALDRFSHKRTDEEWLKQKRNDQKTTYVLFSQGSPYVTWSPDGDGCRVCRFHHNQLEILLDKPKDSQPTLIFLGVGKVPVPNLKSSTTSDPLGRPDSNEHLAWFAVDVADIPEDTIKGIDSSAELLSSKNYLALMSLADVEAGLIGQAKALFSWHDRYKYCPTCGSGMRIEEAGYKHTCEDKECRSLKGVHNTCYPRVDPVTIMAVIHPDGNQLLLGRKKLFPRNMYSCLAGFMEPGETIEDAVRREVNEESGIKVGRVTYHSSQPWPMPSTLMIGCFGYALSTEITVDTQELEDARWFERRDIVAALQAGWGTGDNSGPGSSREGPKLLIPFKQAIAYQLVKAWVGMTANL